MENLLNETQKFSSLLLSEIQSKGISLTGERPKKAEYDNVF
jgi:hypothetical protein